MKSFTYRAVHASGKLQIGRMEAIDENGLSHLLGQKGFELIEAKEEHAYASHSFRFRASTRGSRAQLELFCEQLSDLLGAGLPIEQALGWIFEAMQPGSFRDQLVALEQALSSGSSLHLAFASHISLADPVFLSILMAGEKSGDLAGTFERLTVHVRNANASRRMLYKALRYPLFLFFVAACVTSFMLLFVVPQIVSFLNSLGSELPLMTRVLIRSADIFSTAWWTTPPIVFALYLCLWIARKLDTAFAERSDGWLLALPGLGVVLHKISIARFTGSLALLLRGGTNVPEALAASHATLANRFLQRQALSAHHDLLNGQPLSAATAHIFPPLLLQHVKIGEKTGHLPGTLENMARVAERESQDSLEAFLGSLEPALTLMVGSLLAWIVLAVLGPVYGAIGPLAQGAP